MTGLVASELENQLQALFVKPLNCPADFCTRTQGTIALSSGEAELYAIGQGISETLYVRNLILDAELAKKVKLHIYTDSTAGKSMATRFGSGKKTKHVELRFLYMQDLVSRGDLQIRKVHTTENCADPFSKPLDTETLKSHLGSYVLKLFFVVLICNLELYRHCFTKTLRKLTLVD